LGVNRNLTANELSCATSASRSRELNVALMVGLHPRQPCLDLPVVGKEMSLGYA
jgi:hypothetical protein